jgi:hypothetical protein
VESDEDRKKKKNIVFVHTYPSRISASAVSTHLSGKKNRFIGAHHFKEKFQRGRERNIRRRSCRLRSEPNPATGLSVRLPYGYAQYKVTASPLRFDFSAEPTRRKQSVIGSKPSSLEAPPK